jgi:ABC-type dipeptide/oligopeptide/nickel transport system permease component
VLQYVLRRLLIGIPLVIGVSIVVFVILHLLPGDPVVAALAGSPATPAVIRRLEAQYGLDQPIWLQYWHFAVHAAQGDLGRSYTTGQQVTSVIGSQLGATVELTIAALLLTALVGLTAGVLAATYKGSLVDHLLRFVSVWGSAMPQFWTGIMLIILFSFKLHWFPAAGTGGLKYIVLPAVSLALLSVGIVIKIIRNSTLETLSQPYITALEAKGLTRGAIIVRHVLRNALIPAVTVLGVQVGSLLSGAVIVETVFGRQGIGSLLVQSIEQKDYPLIQGLILFIAAAYVIVNLVVDISYAYVDPRMRVAVEADRG